MSAIPYLLAALVMGLGALMMHLGQLDDSPGLGGIGLLLMLAAAGWSIRRLHQSLRQHGHRP